MKCKIIFVLSISLVSYVWATEINQCQDYFGCMSCKSLNCSTYYMYV